MMSVIGTLSVTALRTKVDAHRNNFCEIEKHCKLGKEYLLTLIPRAFMCVTRGEPRAAYRPMINNPRF
jgi:hypothetical protein